MKNKSEGNQTLLTVEAKTSLERCSDSKPFFCFERFKNEFNR